MAKRTRRKPGEPGTVSITLPLGSQAADDFEKVRQLMVTRMGFHRPTNVQVASQAHRIAGLLIERDPDYYLKLLWTQGTEMKS